MNGWRSTIAIAGRELLSLFATPLGYIVGTLFLLQQGWNFALLLRVLNDPLAAPGPVMQFYFGGSFFIFWLPVIFTSAALSMRLVAEEAKQGTLEALLTAPVEAVHVVLGKFLGAMGFYVSLWIPTVVFYVLLRGTGVSPEWGPILSGYLGTVLVGASFIAAGLLASVLTRSQLGAAIATFVGCTILLLAGLLVEHVESPALNAFLAHTSLLTMMQELAQGIVDWRWPWLHAAFVAACLAAACLALDPRRTREGGVRLVCFMVVVVHLAWWGGRHAARQDWTHGQVYSLSERAAEVLRSLDEPVDVWVIVPTTIGGGKSNPLDQELREVLRRMSEVTQRLRVRWLDPDRSRQQAEQRIAEHRLSGRDLADGVVLVQAGQGVALRRKHLLPSELVTYARGADVQATGPRVAEFRGEEALLGAFVAVTDPVDVTVCATRGHGEPDVSSLEPFAGYAHLKDLVEDAGFEVRFADLDDARGLEACDVVLVAGPAGAFPPTHVAALERFADRGGDLLFLTGAIVTPGSTGLANHGLEPLAARYGVHFGGRVTLDPHPMPGATPLLAFTLNDGWGDHPIVRSFVGEAVSLVFVRELAVEAPSAGGSPPVVLLQAGEDAWAESDLDGLRAGRPLERGDGDRPGPLPVAVAAERGGSRLVVIASDQFALNAYLREDVVYDRGRDLVLNALGWLGGRDVMLGIRARPREHVKLVLLPRQLTRMTWVSILGLPAFWASLGMWVLWRRRPR